MKGEVWLAVWSMLFFIVDAEIKCEFEPDGQMFHMCNATDDSDNILQRGLVSDKRKTFHIILNQCNIVSIELEAFYRLPALAILDLAENKIESLPLGVFDRLPSLSRLNLSYNLLTELPLGIFNHNRDLSVLDLEGNSLHNLKPGLIDPLWRLYQLDLSHNFFKGNEIVPALFDKKRDISILTLSGNDMTEANFLSIMNNLNYLYMDGCKLKVVPKLATDLNMKNLRHLSLASNEITSVDDAKTFSKLKDVMKLNLSRNQIVFIHKDVFKNLRYLEEIDLRYNKLTTLPIDMFQNIPKLYELRLSYNLLTDIPLNAFAGTELKRLSFDNNNITHLHKNFLLKIEDAGLMLRIMHFGNNPWQCACLRELLREAKEMEVLYDTDKYDGGHPVCVSGKDFYCRRDEAAHDEFIRMYNENIR
ncbi:PREDICTED: leucine-rich repeat-containing protein 15-like [Papilio polytes]|uniref:leucine-rich repeat-containing protein 15-like n=1 Tax=Papilio polytes TaxID=76194 RepID=UPI000676719A|nr:PREDICTED: leucine-rich repeat-containing protein 15-like [Papilio polytes]